MPIHRQTKTPDLTTRRMIRALDLYYTSPRGLPDRWALIGELRLGATSNTSDRKLARADHERGADSDWDPRENLDARIDVWAMDLRSDRYRSHELKLTRDDFLREITNPHKREPAKSVSNEHFFVCAEGIAEPEEIPDDSGLLVVYPSLYVRLVKQAPWREMEPLPRSFIASLAIRAS